MYFRALCIAVLCWVAIFRKPMTRCPSIRRALYTDHIGKKSWSPSRVEDMTVFVMGYCLAYIPCSRPFPWCAMCCSNTHYCDVKRPSWRLELPINRVFVQQLAEINNKGAFKVHVIVHLWGNPAVTVTRKMFPFYDVIMTFVPMSVYGLKWYTTQSYFCFCFNTFENKVNICIMVTYLGLMMTQPVREQNHGWFG